MVAAGAPVEAILAAVEADQKAEGERVQARREKDAARKRRQRHADAPSVTRTPRDTQVSLTSLLPSENTEQKQEVIKKVRARSAAKTAIPDEWKPNAAHYAKAQAQNQSARFVDQKADDMRNWAKSKAITRADWDATFHGFLKPGERTNGPRPNGGNRQSGADAFLAGLASVAADIGGDGDMAGATHEEIPRGRFNFDG